MKKSVATKAAFSCGGGAVEYIQGIECHRIVLITDQKTEFNRQMTEKIKNILAAKKAEIYCYLESKSKPDISELLTGMAFIKEKKPDTIIAVGDDATINAAKIMMLLYEHPDTDLEHMERMDTDKVKLQTKFILVPATAGNATGVSQIGTIMIDDAYIH